LLQNLVISHFLLLYPTWRESDWSRFQFLPLPSQIWSLRIYKSYLNLFTCNIGQAFSTSTIQVSEALPKLEEINIDCSNDLIELPAEIFHLIKLKKISITNCHKLIALPREIGKLVNLEILRRGSCIELLELPHAIHLFSFDFYLS